MADFINTIDTLGDDAVFGSIINKTISEFKDTKVTKVGRSAFCKCTALTVVDLPNADEAGIYAFQGCTALKTVNLAKANRLNQRCLEGCNALTELNAPMVKIIDANALVDCAALKRVNFPVLETLYNSGFASCMGLEIADIGTVKSIGGTAFHNCRALKAVVIRNTSTVATLDGAGHFDNGPIAAGTGYIYVPSALYDAYRSASGWTTYTNQFRKLEEWTVDGTVTGEQDIENRHMVRFFNSDGTLLGYDIVTTGGNAVYDGDTPVDPNGENEFTVFYPEPVNVTEDMDCYAQFLDPYAIAWENVFASIDAGTYATDYAIGDTVPLNLGSQGIINMQIAAFDTDDLADGTGKAHITWIAQELLKTKRYYVNESRLGGWEDSDIRSALQSVILPLVPTIVSAKIAEVSKTHKAFIKNGSSKKQITQTTTDKLWIPSQDEVLGTLYPGIFPNTATTADSSRVKVITGSATAESWWLRSQSYDGGSNGLWIADTVGTNGYVNRGLIITSGPNGVCLCFCT